MTRRLTAGIAIAALAVLVGLDLAASPPNPWQAPPAFALGSGQAASGGFCGALPG
ncbi:hypothetical protein [Frigidibacter sp. MR17.24]|uniref:hypothetical protein n=1 Tax=Frigidibacter sp. MR17.24 TaxID=3127345 RepID=UPI003012BF75